MSNALTVSGGGWATHTASAALLSSILDRASKENLIVNATDFKELLANFDRVSGVSGGNWFLSMLAYDHKFERDLAKKSDEWFATGYMGQQKQLFAKEPDGNDQQLNQAIKSFLKPFVVDTIDKVLLQMDTSASKAADSAFSIIKSNEKLNEMLFDILVTYTSKLLKTTLFDSNRISPQITLKFLEGNADWRKFVKSTAFDGFDNFDLTTKRLDRNSWAEDVTILSGAAVDYGLTASTGDGYPDGGIVPQRLTNTKNIDNDLDLLKYYWGQADNRPQDHSYIHALSIVDLPTSMKKSDTLRFLDSSDYYIGSTGDKLDTSYNFDSSLLGISSISGAFLGIAGSLKVYNDLFTASSPKLESLLDEYVGAVDFIADPRRLLMNILGVAPNLLATKLGNLAPAISLKKGRASTNSLNEGWVHRFVDGGYVDNTGAAIAINDIQSSSGIADIAELTLFVNNTSEDPLAKVATTGGTSISMAEDGSKLFNGSGGSVRDLPAVNNMGDSANADFDVNAAFPHIFDTPTLIGTEFLSKTDGKTTLAIQTLQTKTVDNTQFGIKGGQPVRLTVVSTVTNGAHPGPFNNKEFNSYKSMYDALRDAVGSLDSATWQDLVSAFGLTSKVSSQNDKPIENSYDPITGLGDSNVFDETLTSGLLLNRSSSSRAPSRASLVDLSSDNNSPLDLANNQRSAFGVKNTKVTIVNNTAHNLFVKTNSDSDAQKEFSLSPGGSDSITGKLGFKLNGVDVAFDIFSDRRPSNRTRLGYFGFHNPTKGDPYMIADVWGKSTSTSAVTTTGTIINPVDKNKFDHQIKISKQPTLIGRTDSVHRLPPIFRVSGIEAPVGINPWSKTPQDWTLSVEIV